jgi:hypothetical protein
MTPKEAEELSEKQKINVFDLTLVLALDAIPPQKGWRVRPQRERHQLFRGNRAGCLQPISYVPWN